jgi:hypothetical protein
VNVQPTFLALPMFIVHVKANDIQVSYITLDIGSYTSNSAQNLIECQILRERHGYVVHTSKFPSYFHNFNPYLPTSICQPVSIKIGNAFAFTHKDCYNVTVKSRARNYTNSYALAPQPCTNLLSCTNYIKLFAKNPCNRMQVCLDKR